ncbi:MAG: integration host factor [Firmicutes bacterium]|nr:integration host factor [Bacillota bacterium]MBQ3111863.1 integration host factor [Bacillota bacterium]MBQ6842567.1 integration host factor [Bacillota bacterium]MBR6824042.1 integration host factor [Bacillota bacterium]MBR7113392.1 integration host factor [Bacillota bacterium]
MTIPKLSKKDRTAALKKAQEIRSQRMEVRKELKAGNLALATVLEEAENEVYAKMRVKYLLESLPQVGKITAAKIMEEIGIDESRRVQGLGARQKAELLARLG